jgi:serine/threonine-protein kinase
MSFYEFSLADAVITELAHVRSLVVRPSSAIVKYQGQQVDPLEAGRQLNVDAVLTASFLRAGERIRVTAQLLDVRSGEILWSDRIDANAGDIIGVQDAIEHHIVEGLRLELSPDEQVELAKVGTTNAAASEQYLRGRNCLGQFIYHTIAREHVDAAIDHFKRAVEFDPQFALAHSALGSSYVHRVLKGLGEPGDPEKAETAFNKALALDPKLLEARLHMVFIYMNRGEKEKAREEAASLREEYPNDVGVHFVRGVLARLDGDAERSLRSFERMVRLNPAEQVVASYNRARIFTSQGRYEEALHELDLGAALEPGHPMIQTFRAWVLYYRGEVDSATRILQQVLEHHPKMDGIRPVLAMCLSAQGRRREADEQLTAKVKEIATADHDIAYWLASVYALQGEKDEALRWLKIAIRLGNENYRWFKTDPNWTSLHDDLRFKELTGRLEKRLQAGQAN